MITTERIKRGDTAPYNYVIEKFLSDKQGVQPIDVTGKIVLFSMKLDGAETWAIYEKPASVVPLNEYDVNDPDCGRVQYYWEAGETATHGIYKVVWKVVEDDGTYKTYPDWGNQSIFIYPNDM